MLTRKKFDAIIALAAQPIRIKENKMNEKTAIKIAEYRMAGIGGTEIAKKLKLKRTIVYNWLVYFKKHKMKVPLLRVSSRTITDKLKAKHKDWF